MLYIDTTLEDLRLIAENTSGNAEGPWYIRLLDQPTSEEHKLAMTSTQFAAVLFLAINGEEEVDSRLIDTMYDLAEPALVGLEPKFRPIP